jgi:hypothetical protein
MPKQAAISSVDSLPARRRDSVIGLLLIAAIAVWVGSIPGTVARGAPNLDWLTAWGTDVYAGGPDPVLQLPGWAFTLFGITVGGQVILRGADAKLQLRRILGALGLFLAFSALAMVILAVASAFSGSNFADLPVVLVAGLLTWVLAIECGRFVVPSFRTQQEILTEQITAITANQKSLQNRIGRPQPGTGTALRGLALWSAVAGALYLGAMWGSSVLAGLLVFVLGSVLTALKLFLLAEMTAPTLTQQNWWRRVGTRTLWYLSYAAASLFFAISLDGWGVLAGWVIVILSVDLLLPALFAGTSNRTAASIRLAPLLVVRANRELDRLKKITDQRQERLTAHAADETTTTLATRLARAITAFLN